MVQLVGGKKKTTKKKKLVFLIVDSRISIVNRWPKKYLGAYGYEKIGSPQDSEVWRQNK